jgi:hypothetical protein
VEESDENCDALEPEYIWVGPGWLERALTLSALPAFLLACAVAHGLAHFGISELLSFIFAMPLFTLAWFYSVGWLLDRWQFKRYSHRVSIGEQSV